MRALAITLVLCAGCGDGIGTQEKAITCATAVPLHTVQAQVFSGCGGGAYGSGCHQSQPFGSKLDLTDGQSWASLVNFPAQSSQTKFRVVPGDVASSFLWQKLSNQIATDGSEGVPMPRSTTDHWAELGTGDLEAVACWIDGGGKDD